MAGRNGSATPPSQPGRSGRFTAFSVTGSVRIEAAYAPMAMKPTCPRENTPVKPLERLRLTTRITLIPMMMTIRCR